MRLTKFRRVVATAATVALGGTGLVALGALSAAPAGAAGNPNTTYEFDCTTALAAGEVVPIPVTANLNASPDPSAPTGASFGASGALTFSLSGPFLAGLAANGVVGAGGLGLTVSGVNIGPTSTSSTGSYTYGQCLRREPIQCEQHAGGRGVVCLRCYFGHVHVRYRCR